MGCIRTGHAALSGAVLQGDFPLWSGCLGWSAKYPQVPPPLDPSVPRRLRSPKGADTSTAVRTGLLLASDPQNIWGALITPPPPTQASTQPCLLSSGPSLTWPHARGTFIAGNRRGHSDPPHSPCLPFGSGPIAHLPENTILMTHTRILFSRNTGSAFFKVQVLESPNLPLDLFTF